MSEKEKERGGNEQNQENVLVHDVTIHGTYVQVPLPHGATLADLIEELKKGENFNVKDFTVMLNDRFMERNENGTLKENPVLTEKSALTLTKKFVGGDTFKSSWRYLKLLEAGELDQREMRKIARCLRDGRAVRRSRGLRN